jgi:hypothetical protein
VQKKVVYTWFHKHKNAPSTWMHAGHVEKNGDATPKQAKENNAFSKKAVTFFCCLVVAVENFSSHKERKLGFCQITVK